MGLVADEDIPGCRGDHRVPFFDAVVADDEGEALCPIDEVAARPLVEEDGAQLAGMPAPPLGLPVEAERGWTDD